MDPIILSGHDLKEPLIYLDILSMSLKSDNIIFNVILDDSGRKIGHWSWREITDMNDLFPLLSAKDHFDDLTKIAADIRQKISNFPIALLSDIQIYDKADWLKGHGRRALNNFFRIAKHSDCSLAIVEIGKHSLDDCLEGNTDFYTSCGWARFITPTEYSPRFAYCDLSEIETREESRLSDITYEP